MIQPRMHTQPARIGPYTVLEAIGRGGSGAVYRAHDQRLQRDVAIKVLVSQDDSTQADRFLREARAASALNHPNILTIHDVVTDVAPPYIVTELVMGRTLRQVVDTGPVPLARIIDLATQLADGLAAAHAAGLVHRDLKPENVMVTQEGRVKILDFGLSRYAAGTTDDTNQHTITAAHVVHGTAPYMSPEHARGLHVDARSDLFSFGVILYELAYRLSPFHRATTIDTLAAIIH